VNWLITDNFSAGVTAAAGVATAPIMSIASMGAAMMAARRRFMGHLNGRAPEWAMYRAIVPGSHSSVQMLARNRRRS
jgi:hypothetical protein